MQLTLPVRLQDEASFASFHVHAGVAAAVAQLREGLAHPPFGIFLHGPSASGRTHLLQACCHAAVPVEPVVYLPLAGLRAQPAEDVLDGLGERGLVCLDDLDAIAGDPAWERALFALYNRVQGAGASLLVAAASPPGALGIVLADLRSRLQAMLVLALAPPPDDEARLAILSAQCRARGMSLEPEVARFILARAPRGVRELVALAERLDRASLAAGRRLSVPFVREVLGWVEKC